MAGRRALVPVLNGDVHAPAHHNALFLENT